MDATVQVEISKNTLSSAFILSICDHATSKYYISAVIYNAIQSYTLLERVKIKILEKNYLGLRKPINPPLKKINARFCIEVNFAWKVDYFV